MLTAGWKTLLFGLACCILTDPMKTKVLKIDADNVDRAKVTEAAAVIDAGGLVGFPTETVYGIACRVKADSLARLDDVKGRVAEKHYTLHVADKEDIEAYVPTLGWKGRKLIANALPGPLTIVFELTDEDMRSQQMKLGVDIFESLYKDNSIGIRCPDEEVARMLLRETRNAVVAPSANKANEQPAVDGEQALRQLDGQLEMLLDAGPCKYKSSSTVVKIGGRGLKVLRHGIYSRDELEKLTEMNFLFVCTGNTCRSPMAEGIFRKYLAEKLGCDVDDLDKMGYKVSSAGVSGFAGSPVSANAIKACAARGVDISVHRSKGLSQQSIEESDFIFAMERSHLNSIIALDAKAEGRSCLLNDDEEIPDPVGQSQEVYDCCAGIIERAVRERISELKI